MLKTFGFLAALPLLVLLSCSGGVGGDSEAPLLAVEEFQEDLPLLKVNSAPVEPLYYEWHSASLSETKELVQDLHLIPVLGTVGAPRTVRVISTVAPVFAEINIFHGSVSEVDLDGDPDQVIEVTPDLLQATAEGYLLEHHLVGQEPLVVTMTYQFHTPPGYENQGMSNVVAWIFEVS